MREIPPHVKEKMKRSAEEAMTNLRAAGKARKEQEEKEKQAKATPAEVSVTDVKCPDCGADLKIVGNKLIFVKHNI